MEVPQCHMVLKAIEGLIEFHAYVLGIYKEKLNDD